jgi:hypothetical protein
MKDASFCNCVEFVLFEMYFKSSGSRLGWNLIVNASIRIGVMLLHVE